MNWNQVKYVPVKLGEVCNVFNGKTPSKSEQRDKGFPVLKIKDIDEHRNFKGIFDCFVDTQLALKSSLKIIKKGDILILNAAHSSTHVASKMYLANEDTEGALATGEWTMVRTKPDNECNFVYYFLNSKNGNNQLKEVVKGIHLYPKDVSNLQIPLPSLEVQQQIAALLDRADTLRQLDRQLLTHYDTLIQSVFLEMFGDPVKNEKGWEVKKFGEVGESRLGKMLDSKKQNGASKFPYLGNSNVLWGRFKFENLLEMDFDEKDRKEFVLKKGDLLICEGGEVGRSAIWNIELENVYFQKALHRVRLNPKIAEPQYILRLMWFLAHRGGLKDFVTVSTIAHLTGAKLKSLPIPVPPLALQQRFAAIVEKIEAQKATAAAQAEASEALFQGLLQKAFGTK